MDLLVLRAKQWEKAVQGFDQAIAHDPRSPGSVTEFAITLLFLRQFRASEQAYDRLIELVPDQPMLKVQRAYHVTAKSGDATPLRLALDALPASTADDKGALCWRLRFALSSRDWMQAKQLIEKLAGGEDDGGFGWASAPVPVSCYSILLARIQGEQPEVDPAFVQTREQLNEKVTRSPADAALLGKLGLVDALLDHKEAAVSEEPNAPQKGCRSPRMQ